MVRYRGEDVMWSGRRSIKSLFWYWVIGLPLVFFRGVGLIILALAILKLVGSAYAITGEHVVARMGSLFHRGLHEVRFDEVREVRVEKGGVGGRLGYGDVVIETNGGGEVGLWGVDNPDEVHDILVEAMQQKLGA